MDLGGGIFSPLMSKPQNWGGFTIIVRSIKITMQNTFYGIIDMQLNTERKEEAITLFAPEILAWLNFYH